MKGKIKWSQAARNMPSVRSTEVSLSQESGSVACAYCVGTEDPDPNAEHPGNSRYQWSVGCRSESYDSIDSWEETLSHQGQTQAQEESARTRAGVWMCVRCARPWSGANMRESHRDFPSVTVLGGMQCTLYPLETDSLGSSLEATEGWTAAPNQFHPRG